MAKRIQAITCGSVQAQALVDSFDLSDRPVKPPQRAVDFLSDRLKRGMWVPGINAIKVTPDGRLQDGYTLLLAIVQSPGCSIPLVIDRRADDFERFADHCARRRSLRELKEVAIVKHGGTVARACGLVENYYNGNNLCDPVDLQPEAIVYRMDRKYQDMKRVVLFTQSHYTWLMTNRVVAAAFYIISQSIIGEKMRNGGLTKVKGKLSMEQAIAETKAFFELLNTTKGSATDPIQTARRILSDLRAERKFYKYPNVCVGILVKAFNNRMAKSVKESSISHDPVTVVPVVKA